MRRARPLLSAELVLLLGLLALVGIGYVAERWVMSGGSADIGPVFALALAAAPAAIWFFALRAHERAIAASQTTIVWLFAIAAFIAGPAASFVIDRVVAQHPLAPPPLSPLGLERIIAAFLVVGLGYELAKFLVARHAALHRVAGDPLIIFAYTTAVALGFAAHDVYRELHTLGAIPLGAGATRAAALPLAHAAAAGVTACALIAVHTRSLPAIRRAAVLVAGATAAAAAHGGFILAHAAIELDGLAARPGQAAAAVAIAAAALLVLLTLVATRLSEGPAAPHGDEAPR